MADAGVPCAERAWSASNLLQSVSEAAAAVQPRPANFGKLVGDLHTVLSSPSKVEELQSNDERSEPASVRPAEIIVPASMEPRSPSSVRSPLASANKPSPSTLSVLSAAAASLKDKTQQVAQQQKRALSAFQQKGGLVGWLHGEMDESEDRSSCNSNSIPWSAASVPTSPTALQTSREFLSFMRNDDRDDLRTPPSPRSPIESPPAPVISGRRRSMPNMTSGSLLDNFFDKVTGSTASSIVQPSSNAPPPTRVKLRPTVSPTKPSAASFDDFVNEKQPGNRSPRSTAPSSPEIVRQRATTMDFALNADIAAGGSPSPALIKVRSAASLSSSRRAPETRFSLDDVLSDEWSSTVLWAYVYSSADGRDHQHHRRMSFLIETTFRVTPLYRKLAGCNDTNADSEHDFTRLVAALKRLHSRFLVHHGAATLATSGVPVASPAASHAKNQLAVAVHTLNDQRVPTPYGLATDERVEKAVVLLLQLAREVEREFRVLGTRSYTLFADSALYRDFIVHGSSRGNIAMLLRAARIPFYQPPNSLVDPVSLNDLALEHENAAGTVFSRAKCQVFVVTVLLDGSIKFTDVSPNTTADSVLEQTNLQQTIEPFLNPAASSDPAASRPLAFNFSAGSGDKVLYGAVMWLPVDQNQTGEMPSGYCIVSKCPLVDSMRHFLRCLWKRSGNNAILCGAERESVTLEDVEDASFSMCQYFLAHNQKSQLQLALSDSDLPPAVDFRISDLFDCLSLTNVLRLFAFVLLEKKIVLVASSYTVLFSVSETLRTLLHPLLWSHVFVPVLPLALKDCLQCPTPFIFGLHDSYVRCSDLPRPSNDLVVVNLDRDSLTGGGDVFLPPVRHSVLREELFRLCKPHLTSRDSVDSFDTGSSSIAFPVSDVCRLFSKHLREILVSLEPCINRFQLNGQCVSVVDNVSSSQWPADTARFCSAMLHTQAVSTYLASPRCDERAKAERIFV